MNYSLADFHPKLDSDGYHIGLIPDGTGRWAEKKGISAYDAYVFAGQRILSFLETCFANNIKIVSLYFSSYQNFKRSKTRINAFCKAQKLWCETLFPSFIVKFQSKINIVGNTQILPLYLLKALNKLSGDNIGNYSNEINICVAYNPLEEIIQAVKKSDTEEDILSNLWVKDPLDLVIRTGGANVLSNFLPLQSGYARFYTLEKLFPDVEMEDYEQIIKMFTGIERHFGE